MNVTIEGHKIIIDGTKVGYVSSYDLRQTGPDAIPVLNLTLLSPLPSVVLENADVHVHYENLKDFPTNVLIEELKRRGLTKENYG